MYNITFHQKTDPHYASKNPVLGNVGEGLVSLTRDTASLTRDTTYHFCLVARTLARTDVLISVTTDWHGRSQ